MNFDRWRQQARLLDALARLAAGQPILTIALELGYNSPSAFSAMFKRAFGCTPRDYFRQ
jgi:AraC-like DNA-binding protein